MKSNMKHLKKFNEHKDALDYRSVNGGEFSVSKSYENEEILRKERRSLLSNPKELEKKIKEGLDINFDNCILIRTSCRGTWENKHNLGDGYFESFKILLENGALIKDKRDNNVVVYQASEYGRKEFIDYMISKNLVSSTDVKRAKMWIEHSLKMSLDKNKDMMNYLDEKCQYLENVEKLR